MAESELSTTARFVLQVAQAGVGTVEEVGRLMGLEDDDLIGPAAELLAANLISQRRDGALEVTDDGRRILRDGGRTLTPRNRHPRVPYDALTKRLLNMDINRLRRREDVRKQGLFVGPVGPRKPRVSNLLLEEVADYDRLFGRRRGRDEMIEVSAVKDARLKYRDDVVVVKLDPDGTVGSAFTAYRAGRYLKDESAAIQRLAERGVDLVPEEHQRRDADMPWAHSSVVTREESTLLETMDQLDDGILAKDQEVAALEVEQRETAGAQERAALAAEVVRLEAERDDLRAALAGAAEDLKNRTGGSTRLIRTEEHRGVLVEAIDRARREVTLVSAWIGERAFDGEIQSKLVEALRRGARVRIAWGLGTNKPRREGARNRERGENLLKELRRQVPADARELLMERRIETHEKFIICDGVFCAWGSFNWLSYRGEQDSDYRRETSYYSERAEDIGLWRDNARALFDA